MKPLLRFSMALSLALSLSGCASLFQDPDTAVQLEARGRGILMFSWHTTDTCGLNSTQLTVMRTEGKMGVIANMPLNSSSQPSDFSDHYGFVRHFEVEEGDYQLYMLSTNPYVRIKKPEVGGKIHVGAGEAVYAGALEFSGCNPVVLRSVSDLSRRDADTIRLYNGRLRNASFEPRLIKP